MALLFLMKLLSPLPKCVLASVVAISVHRLIKNGIIELKFLWNINRIELWEFLGAFVLPLIIGLEWGIVVAMGLSIIVYLYKISNASIVELGQIKHGNNYEYLPMELFTKTNNELIKPNKINGLIILELGAQLSWTNNKILIDKINNNLYNNNINYIVISMSRTQFIDTTALRSILTKFNEIKNCYITLASVTNEVKLLFDRYKLKFGNNYPNNLRITLTIHDAVESYKKYLNNNNNNNNNIK